VIRIFLRRRYNRTLRENISIYDMALQPWTSTLIFYQTRLLKHCFSPASSTITNIDGLREQGERAHLLDAATKEVRKMLEDNLLHKFRKTPQFAQINEMLFSPPASDDGKHGQAWQEKRGKRTMRQITVETRRVSIR